MFLEIPRFDTPPVAAVFRIRVSVRVRQTLEISNIGGFYLLFYALHRVSTPSFRLKTPLICIIACACKNIFCLLTQVEFCVFVIGIYRVHQIDLQS